MGRQGCQALRQCRDRSVGDESTTAAEHGQLHQHRIQEDPRAPAALRFAPSILVEKQRRHESRKLGHRQHLHQQLGLRYLHGERRKLETSRWRTSVQEENLGCRQANPGAMDWDGIGPVIFVRDPSLHGRRDLGAARGPPPARQLLHHQRRPGRGRTMDLGGLRPPRPCRQCDDGTRRYGALRIRIAGPWPSVRVEGKLLRQHLHPLRANRKASCHRRVGRYRRLLPAVHPNGFAVDGRLGTQEPGRLEEAFPIRSGRCSSSGACCCRARRCGRAQSFGHVR
mmetsp:Transcript_4391/g.12592  ORF Transcript_4391/g.12592 Transcript_4391/m.12592 type:complete len:282 (+) Transcript_4391:2197-3042(+)